VEDGIRLTEAVKRDINLIRLYNIYSRIRKKGIKKA
jgi:hypothetical protein